MTLHCRVPPLVASQGISKLQYFGSEALCFYEPFLVAGRIKAKHDPHCWVISDAAQLP